MSSKAGNNGRRNFIKALSLGGAVAVTAAVLTTGEQPRERAARSEGKRKGAGYRDTAHVREYYKTARV